MSTLTMYGSLADPAVKQQVATALESPTQWTVYLVKKNGKTRTGSQNRLYQMTLRKFSQQLGKSVAHWDEYFVERFLGYMEVLTEDGYCRKALPTTADLSVEEFASFLNAVLAFAAEMQVF